MRSILMSLILVAVFGSLVIAGETPNPVGERYTLPPNFVLEISPLEPMKGGKGIFRALIQARIGSPTGIKVRFLSSEDMKISPEIASGEILIGVLKSGEKKEFQLPVSTTGKKVSSSWLRMMVEYLPDFEARVQQAKNLASFPNDLERAALFAEVQESARKGKTRIDSTRYYLPTSL